MTRMILMTACLLLIAQLTGCKDNKSTRAGYGAAPGMATTYQANDADDADDDGNDEADDDGDEDDDDEADQEIPLNEVPDLVKTAAIIAVPGLMLEEAEVEEENGTLVYTLEGEADGVEYEVEVTAAGEVLEINADEEDGPADDGDDDDGEEDDD